MEKKTLGAGGRDEGAARAGLVMAKQDELSLHEAKLIRLAVEHVLRGNSKGNTYTVKAADLAGVLEVPREDACKETEKLTVGIMRKVVTLQGGKTGRDGRKLWKQIHWVDSVNCSGGSVAIKLSGEALSYAAGMYEHFSSAEYAFISGLPSVHSIRLFELLFSVTRARSDGGCDSPDITIDGDEAGFSMAYLRKYFNCEEKYKNSNDFIRFVIDPSVKVLVKKAPDFIRSHRVEKQGRSITRIFFEMNGWKRLGEDAAV